MKRKSRKKQGSKAVKILLTAIAFLLLLDVFLVWIIRNREDSPGEQEMPVQSTEGVFVPEATVLETSAPDVTETAPVASEPPEKLPEMQLPAVLEDSQLTVLSLFQYSGPNPDCADADGTDIAGILLENSSALFLRTAELEIVTTDGNRVCFRVEDVPPGKTVMVFSRENASIQVNTGCAEITSHAEFEESAPLAAAQIQLQVEGDLIWVENISAEDLTDVIVHCHNVLDNDYVGGITYQYKIDYLPAGECAQIIAQDCYFGMADVVRVEFSSGTAAE